MKTSQPFLLLRQQKITPAVDKRTKNPPTDATTGMRILVFLFFSFSHGIDRQRYEFPSVLRSYKICKTYVSDNFLY